MNGLKFFWNGLRVNRKLYRGWYSLHKPTTFNGITTLDVNLVFHCKDYEDLPPEVRAVFEVKNYSDTQADVFREDQFTIWPDDAGFKEALAAYKAGEVRALARYSARVERKGLQGDDYAQSVLAQIEGKIAEASAAVV